jgi:hypothetical protein
MRQSCKPEKPWDTTTTYQLVFIQNTWMIDNGCDGALSNFMEDMEMEG